MTGRVLSYTFRNTSTLAVRYSKSHRLSVNSSHRCYKSMVSLDTNIIALVALSVSECRVRLCHGGTHDGMIGDGDMTGVNQYAKVTSTPPRRCSFT